MTHLTTGHKQHKMINMKKLCILPVLLLVTGLVSAQTVSDIVRYSTTNTGSARVAAMGGAYGALGGDLSFLGVNPAGAGIFSKSEFSITPFINIAKNKSAGKVTNDASFQLGTLGGVIVFHNKNSNWRGFNFAINYSNLNNFNRTINQYSCNPTTSFNQIWAWNANADLSKILNAPNPPKEIKFDEILDSRTQMAYNTGLITYNEVSGKFEPTLLAGEEKMQHEYIKEDGYQGEYNFSFGTNYKDKLYIGITFGIQNIRYKYKSVFTGQGVERSGDANYFGLNKYNLNKYLKTKGIGTNLKFGLIYRPIPELRIGTAVHTPTFFTMSDNYSENMNSEFFEPDQDNNFNYKSYIIPYDYDYDMRTPWKAVFSLAATLFQKVIISADYEYTDYTKAKFSNGDDGEDFYEPDGRGANDLIKSSLKKILCFRLGAEYYFDSTFCLRGGYSYRESPYKNTDIPRYLRSDPEIHTASVGLGMNFGIFYVDAAYIYKFSKDITTFYFLQDPYDSDYDIIAEPIHNKYINHQGIITLGIKF